MFREGREWLRGPVEQGAGSEHLRAAAHMGLAGLTFLLGDLDEAVALAERGIRIGLGAGALECVMGCHTVLGLVAMARGDLDRAREQIQRSEQLARDLGLDHDVYVALTNLGEIEYTAGNLAEARALWEECLTWVEQQGIGEPAFSHLGLGAVAHAEGRLDDAEAHFSTALARAEAGQLHDLTAQALIRKAALQSDRGNHVEATLTLGRASAYVAATRGEPSGEEARLYDRTRAAALAALGPEQHAQLLAASNNLGI